MWTNNGLILKLDGVGVLKLGKFSLAVDLFPINHFLDLARLVEIHK